MSDEWKSSPFRPSWDRVWRARMHRDAFAECWNTLIKKDAYRITVQQEPNGTLLRIGFKRHEAASNDIALELGEFFYQLRAALDCLIFSAMQRVVGNPVPNEDKLMFPICGNSREFRKRAEYFAPLPYELYVWLERIQPYAAPEDSETLIRQLARLLNLLNDCARKDRHRYLHIIAGYGRETSGTLVFTPEVKVLSTDGVACNLLEDEGEIFEIRIAEHIPNLHVDLNGEVHIDIAIEEIGIAGPSSIEAIDNIGKAVAFVIEHFEAEFGI